MPVPAAVSLPPSSEEKIVLPSSKNLLAAPNPRSSCPGEPSPAPFIGFPELGLPRRQKVGKVRGQALGHPWDMAPGNSCWQIHLGPLFISTHSPEALDFQRRTNRTENTRPLFRTNPQVRTIASSRSSGRAGAGGTPGKSSTGFGVLGLTPLSSKG